MAIEEKIERIKRNSPGQWASADGQIFIVITSYFILVLLNGKKFDFSEWIFSDTMEFGNFSILDASETQLHMNWRKGNRNRRGNKQEFILSRITEMVSKEATAY